MKETRELTLQFRNLSKSKIKQLLKAEKILQKIGLKFETGFHYPSNTREWILKTDIDFEITDIAIRDQLLQDPEVKGEFIEKLSEGKIILKDLKTIEKKKKQEQKEIDKIQDIIDKKYRDEYEK